MNTQIRESIFETNSSSTHSLTICSAEEFEKWQSGELLHHRWKEEFAIPSDVKSEDREDYETYAEFQDQEYLETFEETHTTKSGDTIVAFGRFGYDG